jgi:acyl dehydratase
VAEPNYFFEDVQVGAEEFSGESLVDRDEMLAYARANDPYPIHVDEDSAVRPLPGGPYGSVWCAGG